VEDNYAVAEKLHGAQTLYNVCYSVVANTDYSYKVKQAFITATILLQLGPVAQSVLATGYGLDGPGIESWWGARFSAPVQTGSGPTQSPVQWVPDLSRG
jgi:hypothetical protein